MTISARWKELEPLLDQALDLKESERADWLDSLQLDAGLASLLRRALAMQESPHPLLDGKISVEALVHTISDPAERWVGRELGRWRITGFLGQGGMAAVFGAERTTPPTQIGALKLMQRGLFTEVEREQFRSEQEILARLEHPGICRLIDAGLSADGIPFLVMEPVNGDPIDVFVKNRKLDLKQRMVLIARACDIVAYAQRALVVHRDLKPEHVMIAADGAIKIIDFGIAKLVGEARVTQTYARLGTPRYAAPEHVTGGHVTTATDVYSLGKIAQDLARDSAQNIPRDLGAVLDQACADAPEQRYSSAAELAADLRRWLGQRPVRARQISALSRSLKFLLRHWIPAAAIAAVVLSLLLGVVAERREALRADHAAEVAETARQETQLALDRAQSLNEFIVGLFRADIADVPRDEMPTTRQIVDAGIERARDPSAGAPALRAELLVTLSQILRARVKFDEAATLVDEALALLEPIADENPELLADALISRGAIENSHKRLDLAAPYLERAADWTARKIPGSKLDFEARREIALNEFRRGQLKPARAGFESIDADLEATGKFADLRLKGATDLATVYAYEGEMRRATKSFETVLRLKRETDGTSTVSIVSALNNLASAKGLIGEFAESDRLLDEALALLDKLDGTPLDVRAAVWRGKSENAHRLGHFDQAQQLLETSAEFWRQALSLASVDDDFFLPYYRAQIFADAQQREPAMTDLDRATERMAGSPEARRAQHEMVLVTRARLLCENGEVKSGATQLQAIAKTAAGDELKPTLDAREALARCALAGGDVDAALKWIGSEGSLIEHPEAIGLATVDARRRVLRAEILLAQGNREAAHRDLVAAEANLDAIGVVVVHPLRADIARLNAELSEP